MKLASIFFTFLISLSTTTYSQNHSLYFNGIDNYVKTSQVANVSNNFTIEFWAKPTAEDVIVNEGVPNDIGARMALHPPHGTYNWGTNHAGVGISVATNTITVIEHAHQYLQSQLVWVGNITGWNHIAVVYENKTPKLYVNGTLVHTGIMSSYNYIHPSLGYDGYPGYTNNSGIGTGMVGGHYEGYLDEMRISDIIRYNGNFTPTLTLSNDLNTIGLYHFNEGSGNTTNDASSTNNDGTISGPSWSTDVPARPNHSLNFNGSTYVSIPHSSSLDLSSQFTIECWFTVQGTHTSDWIGMISKTEASHATASGYKLGLLEPFTVSYPNQIDLTLYNYPVSTGVTTSFNPVLNSWYHLAATYDGSIMKLYLNGNLVQEAAVAATILNNTLPLTIGGQNGNFWNRNLNGKIDEVRISSVVRYNFNFTPSTNFENDVNTKALYHFNEGSGSSVADESGNGNTGTIYGATWSTDVPPAQTTTNYSLKLNWNNALTGNHIEVPYSSSINSYYDTKKLTISVWYKPLGSHSGWNWYVRKSIGGCQDDFAFGHSQIDLDNYSYLMLGNPRSCSGDQFLEVFETGFQIGEWYHIETNYDVLNGKAQIYINGQLKAETTSFSNITANQIVTYVLMGMNGLADELHFSNNIRHTQNFIPADEETADGNTIFLYKMNEGSGSILVDASSNHNNATIINPAYVEEWSTDVPGVISSSLSLQTPNGGESWKTYWIRDITWTSTNVANINVFYSSDNGINWEPIVTNLPAGTGIYEWEIPLLDTFITPNCKVKIEDASNPSLYSESVNNFIIWHPWGVVKNSNLGQQVIDFLETNIDLSLNVTATDTITTTYYPYEAPINGALPSGIEVSSDYFWHISSPNVNFNNGKIIIPISTLRGVTDASKLVWLKRNNPGDAWSDIGGAIVGDNLESTALFNSFSEFVIGSTDPANPLPVELSSFTAMSKSDQVILKWGTKTETNNYGFDIERKVSDQWQHIGFINGNGNSNSPKEYSFLDKTPIGGSKFQYRLKQIDNDGQFEYSKVVEVELVPNEYAIFQNYPNPFNPATKIRYQLPKESKVVIKIYNILGSEITELVNEQKEAGIYEVEFNARNLSSGTYIYRIIAGDFVQTRKMILLK